MHALSFMWWGGKCFIGNVKSSYGTERYSLTGLYIIRVLINLIKDLIMQFLSSEPLLKSKGELQMESLQDKVLAWESIKESFILECRLIASLFITALKVDNYQVFSTSQTHHYPYIRSYWLCLNYLMEITLWPKSTIVEGCCFISPDLETGY